VALVYEALPAGGQAPPTAESGRRFRLASPRTAVVLGVLTFVLAVVYVPLAYPARDVSDGWVVLLSLLAFAVPGVVVALHQALEPAHVSVWISPRD
jgi:ABC-type Fe3+ transport system permease subunit